MFGIPLEEIIVLLGYLGIFLLMIPNGIIGFPSSQILYIICGYFIYNGELKWLPVVAVGALGNTIGNIILYEIIRRNGIKAITKYQLFSEKPIKRVERAFQKKGGWFLFIGKLTPALKVFAPIAAALGKMRRDRYILVILISSTIWALPFLAIGYYFGKSTQVFGTYAIILLILAGLIALGFWRYVKRQNASDL